LTIYLRGDCYQISQTNTTEVTAIANNCPTSFRKFSSSCIVSRSCGENDWRISFGIWVAPVRQSTAAMMSVKIKAITMINM